MNENQTTITRNQLEADIVQQIQNDVQEALLLHAPTTWSDERLDHIEQQVLDHTRLVLDALSTVELQSEGALRTHIGQAVADTKRILRQGDLGRKS